MPYSRLVLNFVNIFLFWLVLIHVPAFASLGFDSSPPNERHPKGLLKTTRHAFSGSAIVVGAERGLFLASLNPQITSLFQIDFLDDIVRLNEIHRALLIVAQDVADYQKLRSADSYARWRAGRESMLFPGTEVLTWQNFRWWRGLVKLGKVEASSRNIRDDFLEKKNLFSRLQNLARAGKIQILKLDLNDKEDFIKLLLRIRQEGENISVVDLSNAWWPSYVGAAGILRLAKGSANLLNPDTIWLFSYRHDDSIWKYFGFHTNEFLKRQIPFVDLASVVETQYGAVLAAMPAIEGLNKNLARWLPPHVNLRGSKFGCESLLRGQVDFIESKIKLGRERL